MKYLFFDIDGTLLSHTEGISKSTIDALKLAKEKGHKIFICTGRSYSEIPELIYTFNFDGVIAAAGGYVKIGNKVIFNKIMPEHLIDNIIYQLDKMDIPFMLEGVEKTYSHKDARYIYDERNLKRKAIKDKTNYEHSAYDYRIPELFTIDEYFSNRTPISKMTLYGNGPESYFELEQFIDKDFYLLKYDIYAELISKGISKLTGIEKVMNYLNASMNETFAFGDSLNDYEMIRGANIGIAVGNSSEPVKKIADFITDDIHDNGIYNAMKHYNLI